jgi:hypothetical protein
MKIGAYFFSWSLEGSPIRRRANGYAGSFAESSNERQET